MEELWPPERDSRNVIFVREKSPARILPATEKGAQEKPDKVQNDPRDLNATGGSAKTVASLCLHPIILGT